MKFTELVNIDELKVLCENFTSLTGMVTAILDLEGNILTASGWQSICTHFHRANPISAARCRESDTSLSGDLREGERANIYKCKNGLVDVAVPIKVRGEHVANFFTGQFFLEPPDIEFFIKQAEELGFDKEGYLEALYKVPVLSSNTVKSTVNFFSNLGQFFGEMGLAKKELKEANVEIRQEAKRFSESEEKFRALAETSPLAMVMTSGIDQVIQYLNPAAVKLFGYTHDEIPTIEEWWPLAYPDDEYRDRVATEWQQRVVHAIATGSEIEPVETVVTCKDGSTKNVLWYFSAVGKQNWVLGLDLTGQKKAELERENLIVQLQDKNAELERFVYTVSHDLKSPLVTINGFCGAAKEDFASGDREQGKNSLDIISNAAIRMQKLLNDLLQISRVGVKINPSEIVNLEALIKEAIESVSGVIAEHRTNIEIESELPDVIADKQYLLQVIENLLANASRYSSSAKGGSHVKIGFTRNAEELICYVKDNGIGIESQYLEKVFGLFERLDADSDSTGVGLAIVKRIIENHGGRIWAQSEGLGHGTTFFFTLSEA